MMKPNKANRMHQIESLVLPVVLLLTGLILIGGDRAGILSLDRIQNFWPVALILIGLSDLLTGSGEDSREGERRV
jgi:hypothetical protein